MSQRNVYWRNWLINRIIDKHTHDVPQLYSSFWTFLLNMHISIHVKRRKRPANTPIHNHSTTCFIQYTSSEHWLQKIITCPYLNTFSENMEPEAIPAISQTVCWSHANILFYTYISTYIGKQSFIQNKKCNLLKDWIFIFSPMQSAHYSQTFVILTAYVFQRNLFFFIISCLCKNPHAISLGMVGKLLCYLKYYQL